MPIGTEGGKRALAGGLLVLVLVVTGAMPAAAGGSVPGSGPGGKPAGAQSGGGHKSTVSAKQVSTASKPSARKSQGGSPRPARHSAARPQVAKAPAAAPAKPSAAPKKPSPAEHKPVQRDEAPEPDQPEQRGEDSKPSAHGPRTEVRSATVFAVRQPVSRADRPRPARAIDRPVTAVVASAADPSTALFGPPPVVEIQAAAVELEPRRFWPRLPGAAGHPAFPGLLAAVLLGFIALGFRGDRRDPKLAAAAIDDRDDRAEFR